MNDDGSVEDKDLFNDLFDEVIENLGEKDKPLERPLCDSLANLDKQYKEFHLLAKGGMKQIYKVFDRKLNRYVAYARLHANSPYELHDPFIREARLTALLEHPNIISVHDMGMQEDDTPFFTMELKVGKNLGEIIREQSEPLKPETELFDRLLESFVKVCDAISFAHSKNVLHLDLKPENIQIGSFGEVIVCDWGLGKIIGDNDIEYDQLLFNPDLLNNVTRLDKIVGTPGYMAPEQIHLSGEKTKQTDIYSLGAVLYTILTGKCAFEGDTEEVLNDTVNGKMTAPEVLGLPASLSAVVMKAMSVNTKGRYQSVNELKNEVQNYLSGRATLAEQAGLFKEVKLFYKRNLLTCNIALASFTLILIIGVTFLIKLQQKNVSLEIAKKEAEKNFIQAEEEKAKVKENLDRMIIEKDLATALLGNDFEEIRESFELVDSKVFFDPVNALREAEVQLLKIPDSHRAFSWAQMQLNYIYFIRQEFNRLDYKFFTTDEKKEFIELLAKAQGKSLSGLVSEIKNFKNLFQWYVNQPYNIGSAIKVLKYDGVSRINKKDHSVLVELVLRFINKSWQGNFNYNEDNCSLSIQGKGFARCSLEPSEMYQRGSTLDVKVSLINSLPIKQLNVSGTDISNLWEIANLELETLVIKDVRFRDLTPLQEMQGLKNIVVSKGFFSDDELSKVPSHIQILAE